MMYIQKVYVAVFLVCSDFNSKKYVRLYIGF